MRVVVAALLILLACTPASAQSVADPLDAAVLGPAVGAIEERLTGVLHRVGVDDRVAGLFVNLYSIERDDGTALSLKGASLQGVEDGARIEVTGRRNGNTLFVSAARQLAPPAEQKAVQLVELQGRLALLHFDYFTEGRGEFVFELHGAAAKPITLKFPVFPEALQPGMQVVVRGRPAADGAWLWPDTVTITALPPNRVSSQGDLTKAPVTNKVLVILMTFTDSPNILFSKPDVEGVLIGGPGSGSVTDYYREVSFGQQLVNFTVTDWLPINAATPPDCDVAQMANLGKSAATAAMYNVASYQNFMLVFPKDSDCSWQGLGEVDGNTSWINGKNNTLVFGHELGHNLGLRHAGSLSCSSVAIGGACSVNEYGDPFDIMGNKNPMHPNAAQKLALGWIGTNTVATHTAGTRTYVLEPIETAGGSLYAVKIPAAANRTYWLEYRQPIGFDVAPAGYPNNGAQVRVASPFETLCSSCDAFSNDTQLLDMTPATSTFTDAALIAGTSFTDADTGVSIDVLSATTSGVTVQVSGPIGATPTTTVLLSSLDPATLGVSVTFTALVTGSAPSGTVRFTADGTALAGCGGIALVVSGDNGSAVCSTSGLAVGGHNIVAAYLGDGVNAASSSDTFVETILPERTATTTTLATSANPAVQGAKITLTATVKGSAPTGSVRFADGFVSVNACGNVALAGSGDIRTATCNTTSLAVGTHGIVASYGGDVGNQSSASATLSQVVNTSLTGTVWVDDGTPAGAVRGGIAEGWNWTTTDPAAYWGAQAHQSALVAGVHQHYFFGASNPLAVGVTDTLYTYVYLDPASPPTEVMLQWHDGASWEHRAYWGANSVAWGVDGTTSRRYMGPLPATGQWVRLSVLAAQVGLDGKSVSGMAFTLYDGRATWDLTGVETGAVPSAAQWIDDSVPAGAVAAGSGEGWNWITADPAPFSGALAHQSVVAAGVHQHYLFGASSKLAVGAADTLYAYVYLDPANPPTEVMLQWHDGGSWEHRAYWGANNVGWGIDTTASRRYMGPLPATGQWVRLAVPAAQVGLDGKSVSGMAFTLYDGRATWDIAGIESGVALLPPPAWVEDSVPPGAEAAGMFDEWTWTSTDPAPFSGMLAHQSVLAAGVHQHYFYGASAPLSVGVDDTLYAYVYLDPANPPTEVMLQWHDGAGWEHRAYWGDDNVKWGIEGTASRRRMGELPPAGQWVRLSIPAAQVGLDGKSVIGMAFTLYDGRATWDRAGSAAGTPQTVVWIEDAVPAGAVAGGMFDDWTWTSTDPVPFAGAVAHRSALAAGVHHHYFYGASAPWSVAANDTLYAYVYLDPANPPSEVMLQWHDGASWEHRAYWGDNHIDWGVKGSASRRFLGRLPPIGQWVRLEVRAADVGLDGKSVGGMAFTLYDGRATWDYVGKE